MSFPKIFKSNSAKSELKDEILNPLVTIQNWSNTVNYEPYTLIRKGGVLYFSKAASGPNTSADAQDPASDTNHTYWSAISVDDSNVVHRTGNEEINNVKSFTSSIMITGVGSAFSMDNPGFDRSYVPTPEDDAYHQWLLRLRDKNYKRVGGVYFSRYNNNAVLTRILTMDANDEGSVSLGVGYDENGIPIAQAPSTSTSRTNGGDIVTRDFIPNDTRIVHISGDEVISGSKTFTNGFAIINDNPIFAERNNTFTRASTLTEDFNTWPLMYLDKNSYKIGGIHFRKKKNKW